MGCASESLIVLRQTLCRAARGAARALQSSTALGATPGAQQLLHPLEMDNACARTARIGTPRPRGAH
jgi:hypothetical protein